MARLGIDFDALMRHIDEVIGPAENVDTSLVEQQNAFTTHEVANFTGQLLASIDEVLGENLPKSDTQPKSL